MGRYNTPPRLDPEDNKEEALDALQVGNAERAQVFATLALVDELRNLRWLIEKHTRTYLDD